jgi:hypothetical protein
MGLTFTNTSESQGVNTLNGLGSIHSKTYNPNAASYFSPLSMSQSHGMAEPVNLSKKHIPSYSVRLPGSFGGSLREVIKTQMGGASPVSPSVSLTKKSKIVTQDEKYGGFILLVDFFFFFFFFFLFLVLFLFLLSSEKQKRRDDILNEMMINETKYVSLLSSILECVINLRKWINKMQEKEEKGKAKNASESVMGSDVKVIFGEIETIYNLHNTLLKKVNDCKSNRWKVWLVFLQ